MRILAMSLVALLGCSVAAAQAGPKPAAPAAQARAKPSEAEARKVRKVKLKTVDGWGLYADYRPRAKGKPVAVLVHGYGASREEWSGLASDLARKGWGSLALDLRGHGDSTEGPSGKADFSFVDSRGDWSEAIKDIESAVKLVSGEGVPRSRICLVGASIGANLAAAAASSLPGLGCVALLSPGRDYRGVVLDESPRPKTRTLVAASPADPYAYQTLVGFKAGRTGHVLLEASKGHGVAMFQDVDFYKSLLAWLDGVGRK
ncbi:MAG: alpha/beta fold hydrolase [Elusimicrobia bacterium]|nr:alpha/beta fold hydrolase [Elusimicrobiota bacterium]